MNAVFILAVVSLVAGLAVADWRFYKNDSPRQKGLVEWLRDVH